MLKPDLKPNRAPAITAATPLSGTRSISPPAAAAESNEHLGRQDAALPGSILPAGVGKIDNTAAAAVIVSADERSASDKEKAADPARSTATPADAPEDSDAGEDDDSKYPRALPLALLTFGLCLSLFVVALDSSIIATAIPRITTVFNSLNDVGWYGSSYLLTTTALQPSFGKVYTYFNIKWTFIFALSLFELGSVICGAARDSTMLIVGRAIAGAGGAALYSGTLTIIGYAVPLRKRAIYIAIVSSMFGISSLIGPVLGGALTDRVSWRWCVSWAAVAMLNGFCWTDSPTVLY